jgi:hypothetical protein
MDVISYIRLRSFEVRREENQYFLVLLSDKQYYTKFMGKLQALEDKIERKRKMRRFNEFRVNYPQLLESPKKMNKEETDLLYQYFKTVLVGLFST